MQDLNTLPLDENIYSAVKTLAGTATVKAALEQCVSEAEFAKAEQIRISEIPSPTFKESVRAAEIARLMKAYGLTDVVTDPIGNVVGRRPGRLGDKGPVLALGAHMDTVFPEGTDVSVKERDGVYYGPGLGDNASNLRSMLQIIRALNEQNIVTEGTLLFVGTVGEEGNGDIRGAKALFDGTRHIDGFLALDSSDVRRILCGATGSHRWRITITGPGGHSWADFGRAPSAVHAMGRAISMVADLEVPAEPRTTFSVGLVRGGTSVNTIAPSAQVDVDMRSVDNAALLAVEGQILPLFNKAIEQENARWNITDESLKLKVSFEQIGSRPAGQRPVECPVLQCARSAQKVLGIPLTKYDSASTDANKPMSMGIPATCISSGGIGRGAHTPQENFVFEDIHLGPQLAILTALALVGTDGCAPVLPRLAKMPL
mgnify:CR=1 FL=1